MNKEKASPSQPQAEPYKFLRILDELSLNNSVTQRDLSRSLGIALGLVNSYLRNLVAKGYVTVKAIPPKRYAYFLTPSGFAEKTRLTYHLLKDYTRIYRETRENLKKLFRGLEGEGVRRLVFAGADEVAEIAYLTLQETGLVLVGVVDGERKGKQFFGKQIEPLETAGDMQYDLIIVSSYVRRETIFRELIGNGVDKGAIRVIFPL